MLPELDDEQPQSLTSEHGWPGSAGGTVTLVVIVNALLVAATLLLSGCGCGCGPNPPQARCAPIEEAWPWPRPGLHPDLKPVSALKPENVAKQAQFRLLPDDQLEEGIRNCIKFGLGLNDKQREYIKSHPGKFQ